MSDPTTEMLSLRLEELLRSHEIDASIFAPFVIARLRGKFEDSEAVLLVRIGEVDASDERALQVLIQWEPGSAFAQPVAVQERVLTEWAALGVACLLLPGLLNVWITSVAVEGESFDDRVSDGSNEWGLEVSGTMTEYDGVLRGRLGLKIRQLQSNPSGMVGYVVVVAFVRREALIAVPDSENPEEAR